MKAEETSGKSARTTSLGRLVSGLAVIILLQPLPARAEPPAALAQVEEPRSLSGKVVQLPGNAVSVRREGEAPAWGTTAQSIHQIHALQFVPLESSTTYSGFGPTGMRHRTGGVEPWFIASLSLPTGVRLRKLEVYACDLNPGLDMDIYVSIVAYVPGPLEYGATVTSGEPGCNWYSVDLTPADFTVDNYNRGHLVAVNLPATDDSTRFREVNVYYQRQVSAPPPGNTFADVPVTHPFYRHVEALVGAGITSGCGGGNFCPDSPVTRGQMASFLARALGLHWPL